jgi:hypothetical protein
MERSRLLVTVRAEHGLRQATVSLIMTLAMKMKALLPIVAFVLLAGSLALCLFPVTTGTVCPSSRSQARREIQTLISGAKAYWIEYEKPPEGDNKTILQKLQGSNPRNLVFLELDPKRVSSEGLYLDPWGTPYAFNLSKASDSWGFSLWAYSFGRNKIDEGGNGDDIASWQ